MKGLAHAKIDLALLPTVRRAAASTPEEKLVPDVPSDSEEARRVMREATTPAYPYKVTYSPKWRAKEGFTSGTVICQHGRHKTLEGAARCAAAHHQALAQKIEFFSVRVEAAPSVLWHAGDGRRWPKERPTGE